MNTARVSTRSMPHAQQLGIEDDSGSLFRELAGGRADQRPARRGTRRDRAASGLSAGQSCYVAAYAALRDREIPQRVVVLGTNHFGRSGSVVATNLSLLDPPRHDTHRYRVHRAAGERCGPLRTYELDHAREHSIELQVGLAPAPVRPRVVQARTAALPGPLRGSRLRPETEDRGRPDGIRPGCCASCSPRMSIGHPAGGGSGLKSRRPGVRRRAARHFRRTTRARPPP